MESHLHHDQSTQHLCNVCGLTHKRMRCGVCLSRNRIHILLHTFDQRLIFYLSFSRFGWAAPHKTLINDPQVLLPVVHLVAVHMGATCRTHGGRCQLSSPPPPPPPPPPLLLLLLLPARSQRLGCGGSRSTSSRRVAAATSTCPVYSIGSAEHGGATSMRLKVRLGNI